MFGWRSSLSAAKNSNKVLALGIAKQIPYTGDKGISGQTGGAVMVIKVGEPLSSFYGLRTNGLYQQGDACPLTVTRPTLDCVPGEYKYVDTNGDGKIDANDRVILGNGQPDWYGGLTNEFTAGPINVNVFFQGSFGAEILNGPAINTRNVSNLSNQTTDALNRWTPTNTNTNIPRANVNRPREAARRARRGRLVHPPAEPRGRLPAPRDAAPRRGQRAPGRDGTEPPRLDEVHGLRSRGEQLRWRRACARRRPRRLSPCSHLEHRHQHGLLISRGARRRRAPRIRYHAMRNCSHMTRDSIAPRVGRLALALALVAAPPAPTC